MGPKQDKKTKSVSRQQMIVNVNRALDKGAETGSLPRGSRDADGLAAEAASQKEAAGIGSRTHRTPSGWKVKSTFLFK